MLPVYCFPWILQCCFPRHCAVLAAFRRSAFLDHPLLTHFPPHCGTFLTSLVPLRPFLALHNRHRCSHFRSRFFHQRLPSLRPSLVHMPPPSWAVAEAPLAPEVCKACPRLLSTGALPRFQGPGQHCGHLPAAATFSGGGDSSSHSVHHPSRVGQLAQPCVCTRARVRACGAVVVGGGPRGRCARGGYPTAVTRSAAQAAVDTSLGDRHLLLTDRCVAEKTGKR